LDANGFARVLVGIDPPRIDDSKFRGLITIRAFMDEDGFDDVAEGNLVLKIRNSGKIRTIILDPDKGITENNDRQFFSLPQQNQVFPLPVFSE